jgi:hypothetical protein
MKTGKIVLWEVHERIVSSSNAKSSSRTAQESKGADTEVTMMKSMISFILHSADLFGAPWSEAKKRR